MKKIEFPPQMNMGRMLSGSKSGYRDRYPTNLVIFNSNMVTLSDGKVWYGDIDAHRDKDMLLYLRAELDEDLFFLNEMDGRFEHEDDHSLMMISKAIFAVRKDRIELLPEWYRNHYGESI